jgi:hypothetical protein
MGFVICVVFIVGVIVIALLAGYLVLGVFYLFLKDRAEPAISMHKMPTLKPVPIG